MTKQDVIAMIEKEWNAFVSLAKSFKDGDRVRAGAIGHWNIHEGLLHVAAWDNDTILSVRQFEETGAMPDWLGLSGDARDALNESHLAERRNLDPSLIWSHFRNTHQDLVDFLETCDERVFIEGSFIGDSIKMCTWKHYPAHGQDFTRFKESL
tara:strand:- start:160 stop:618 length:459 start_codon:yes stop_codon:yes gene_type:complete